MPNREIQRRLSADAFSACMEEFVREQGRSLDADEQGIARRAADLSVQWTATQPVERFLPKESLAGYFMRRATGGRAERRRRRLNRREERAAVRECRHFVEANWHGTLGEGYGFIFSLISAVLWHLIVVLIVRWILKKYFENPALAMEVCQG